MGPCASCALNSSGNHLRVISACLRVSDSASGSLRPPWLLGLLNAQFLCATPRQASILINEWVSLRDYCKGWGWGRHHSRKFLSHVRKRKLARRSLVPFLQNKALTYFPHFHPDKSYDGSQIEEKHHISLLTTQPRPFSPLQRRDLGIFQPSPGYSLIFFPIKSPSQVPFHWVGNSPSTFQPAPHPVSFAWVEISQYLSAEPHLVSRPWVGVPWMFHPGPLQYLSYWEGAGNLLHRQIKLGISTNTGDSTTRRDLLKFVCTPREGGWAQGATAGTKAPVPRGVQSKEGSPLWVASSVAITVD